MFLIKSFLTVLSFCLLTFIFLSGCADNPVKPTYQSPVVGTVTGRVFEYDGIPAEGRKVAYIRYDTQVVTTSHTGLFTLYNVLLPYDLVLVTGNDEYTYFQYLNTLNPVLNEYYGQVNYPAVANIHITFNDSITNTHKILACFFDSTGEYFSSNFYFYTNNAFISVGFLNYNPPPVNGKVILLNYTQDAQYRIISFDKYREAQLTIQKNGGYSLDMSNTPYMNPGADTITCDIRYEPGAGYKYHSLYINEGSFFNIGLPGVSLYQNNDTIGYFKLLVPGASTHFKYYLIYNEDIMNGGFSTMSCQRVAQVYPGYNSLVTEQAPVLTSPQNNSTIDYTTKFSYSYTDGWGIYFTKLTGFDNGDYKELNIISASPEINIPDLRYLSLNFSGNVGWSISKFDNFSSLDEFMELPYSLSPNWKKNSYRSGESFMFSSAKKRAR